MAIADFDSEYRFQAPTSAADQMGTFDRCRLKAELQTVYRFLEINHEETEIAKVISDLSSRSPFLRG